MPGFFHGLRVYIINEIRADRDEQFERYHHRMNVALFVAAGVLANAGIVAYKFGYFSE